MRYTTKHLPIVVPVTLVPIAGDRRKIPNVKVVRAMLKFIALAVTAICVYALPVADVLAQAGFPGQPPELQNQLIVPQTNGFSIGTPSSDTHPPVQQPMGLQPPTMQMSPAPVAISDPYVGQEIQNQPQFLQDSQFIPDADNGLPSKGALWLSVERVFGDYKDSNSLIGDSRAPQAFGDRFMAVDLSALEGTHVGLTELDPSLVGQEIGNDNPMGTRVRAGFRTFNNGGLEFDGLWMEDNETFWKRGLGGLNAGADPTTVRVTAALPLYDGTDGYAVPYDQYFRIGINTQTNSYGLHFAPKGMWWGAILLQPTIGVRMIELDEQVGFAAADSGLSYQHNPDGTPIATSLDPPVVAVPPYQSTLSSNASTSLIGPLIGMNYHTTGKAIRFSGDTRAGIYYAESTQSLAGQGFGNGFGVGFNPLLTFSDSLRSDYATAAFEQNINLDIDLLRILPPFKANKTSSSLVLRLGWGLMAVHRVVRPVDSINWNGFPLTPDISESKDSWYLQTWSVGALYQY